MTANDNLDADTGPNQLQNYPVVTSVVGNQVFGSVHSTPGVVLRLEFFSSTARDPSGFGEGRTYLGTLSVTPDGNGNASFTFNAPSSLVGLYASATATPTLGGTSEFGNAVLGIATPTAIVIPVAVPPQVPNAVPNAIPNPVPVLRPVLVPVAGTPILNPVPGGPTVATGVPTVTAGDIAPTAGAQNALATKAVLAASQGPGGSGSVRVFNPDGTQRAEAPIFQGFAGGIRIGTADVNGDGVLDGIAAVGLGGTNGHVKVFSGIDGSLIRSFFAFQGFTGAVNVTGGDINADGCAEIIVGAGAQGGHVKVFDGATGALLSSFFAFPGYLGAVTVAAGDFNNDGIDDLVVGTEALSTHVKVIDGTSLNQFNANGSIADAALLGSFFAYTGFGGGVFVSAGDLNDDGIADVITGAGPGATPHVKVFGGAGGPLLASFFGFQPEFRGGVRVGVADTNQDGADELVVGAGPGAGPHVKAVGRTSLAALDANGRISDAGLASSFFAFGAGFAGGVYVD